MRNISYHKITVSEMAPHVHSFAHGENKVDKITDWLKNWIINSLKNKKIKPYDFLPKKGDLAYHIGVSQGTIQAAFRKLEDYGLVESKQRCGTYIKPGNLNHVKKMTSKRDVIINLIKQYLKNNDYSNGDKFISARKLANLINIPNSTVRNAYLTLVTEGILKKNKNDFWVINTDFNTKKLVSKTLVEKTANDIETYIKNHSVQENKLPSNTFLAKELKVSTKTIHDAVKLLSKKGILYTRRGRYGTRIVDNNSTQDTLYCYEKIAGQIKNYITENSKIGDKLPTIKELVNKYNSCEKTIKRALDELAEDGLVTFTRGRYGGIFVTDVPQKSKMAYKWVILDSGFVQKEE